MVAHIGKNSSQIIFKSHLNLILDNVALARLCQEKKRQGGHDKDSFDHSFVQLEITWS